MKSQIPARWKTTHLIITDSTKDEVNKLQEIYDDCSYIGKWTGGKDISRTPMLSELNHEDLPPKGIKNRHRVQSIYLKKGGKLIGYLVLYHGFPNSGTLWIATLAIRKLHQGKGFGQEVVRQLSKKVKKLRKYSTLGINVGIKNWPALRFWIQAGFDKIWKFNGAKVYSERTFANLALLKEI